MSEGKTYSKKLMEINKLGKNDQVIVLKSGADKMVAQYFCDEGNCTISVCENCLKNKSGYLDLIMHTSHGDRFDAFRNSEKTPFLSNFTLDEDVSSTSTTKAVPEETHIPSIKPNEPLHTTKHHEADPGEALSAGAIVAIAIGVIGALVALVALVAVIADIAIARRAGRDAITTKAFTFLRRMFRNREPNQPVENPTEMEVFVPNPN
ncbi:hypothetical protein R3I94_017566 [Phoxinus phoxinus]